MFGRTSLGIVFALVNACTSASDPDVAANELWHAYVCHGPDLGLPGKRVHLRIHGIVDDASRDLIAIEARTNETEDTLLGVLVDAVKRRGRSDGLYLDNGSTHSGDTLAIACGRLGQKPRPKEGRRQQMEKDQPVRSPRIA